MSEILFPTNSPGSIREAQEEAGEVTVGGIAQLVEPRILNSQVRGSSPRAPSMEIPWMLLIVPLSMLGTVGLGLYGLWRWFWWADKKMKEDSDKFFRSLK